MLPHDSLINHTEYAKNNNEQRKQHDRSNIPHPRQNLNALPQLSDSVRN